MGDARDADDALGAINPVWLHDETADLGRAQVNRSHHLRA